MKRLAAVLAILAAIYYLPTIGMNAAASSRGVMTIPVPTDSWINRRLTSFEEKRAFRIKVDAGTFPNLEAVVAMARPEGRQVERSSGDVVFQYEEGGLDRAIEFRMPALDDPERLENTLTVVEAIHCRGGFACIKHDVFRAMDEAQSAYSLSNLAGLRKTPGAG
jgi:hypothetical protein